LPELTGIDPELIKERLWSLEARRFSSTQIQLTSVTDLGDSVRSVLEIGPGNGYFSTILSTLGYAIKTADIRKRTDPDFLGDFRDIEINEKFDLIAAFEMLQHLPYSDVSRTISKIADMSKRYVLISVPARIHQLSFEIEVPKIFAPRRLGLGWMQGKHSIVMNWEWPRGKDITESNRIERNDYWNAHHWEIGRRSYPRSRFLNDLESTGLKIIWHKYNPQHTHHLFVLAQKNTLDNAAL
tara:strand:+ start:401 stop:1120 length:720 start_codon:yes stop_codon:yes gene_type:complete